MSLYRDIFETGKRYDAFVQDGLASERTAAKAFVEKTGQADTFSGTSLDRLANLRGHYHLLVAAEIWCPDCQINLAVMDFMRQVQPNIELAIVSKGRAENNYRTALGLERIPVPLVAILDEAYELIGTFVERPSVVANDSSGQALIRYKAGEHMEDTLRDLLEVMERHEGQGGNQCGHVLEANGIEGIHPAARATAN
ncbi:thioredoxin family protein [Pseudomonas massiliensis]|uniref:thioredoxin family protein n=1 Tax=Pseudomonas massiliensis TaxID=522492 RepID=UPI000693C7B2|nr:thioredoxin family protein [Pseudomonas massiliensis]